MSDEFEELPGFDEMVERIAAEICAHTPALAGDGEFKIPVKFLITGPTRFYPSRTMTIVIKVRRSGDKFEVPDRARQGEIIAGKLRHARRAYLN